MIPVSLYRSKLDELQHVLQSMGKDPGSVSDWVFKEMATGNLKLAAIRDKGAQSVALVKSLPKVETSTILGLRLTEPKQERRVLSLLSSDQQRIMEEINDIEGIERVVRRLYGQVKSRIHAVTMAIGDLREQARSDGQGAGQAQARAVQLENAVLPILARLKTELSNAVHFLAAEIRIRAERHDQLDRKQLAVPRYNRRARRKRKARAAVAAGAKKQDILDGGDEGGAGGGGDGD